MGNDLEQLLVNEMWLDLFNNYLFAQQVISETERNKMDSQIRLWVGEQRKKLE